MILDPFHTLAYVDVIWGFYQPDNNLLAEPLATTLTPSTNPHNSLPIPYMMVGLYCMQVLNHNNKPASKIYEQFPSHFHVNEIAISPSISPRPQERYPTTVWSSFTFICGPQYYQASTSQQKCIIKHYSLIKPRHN